MHVFGKSRFARLASASVVSLFIASPALAQAPSEDGVGTIIVTAQKRSENIQDVPIAVTALGAEQIERAGIADIRTLGNLSSSFNLNSSQTESQGTTIRIRGVGTTGNNIGLESAVGVFVDGVYLSRPGVALGELLDLQQIEVLRGPQGTLFGRNVSAGALNITTRSPSLSGIEGYGNVTYGNFGLASVQAGISLPIVTDELGVRFSVAGRIRDALLESTTGAESNTRDRFAVRGQALWEPTPSLSFRLIADYSEADEDCCDAPIVRDFGVTAQGAFTAYGLSADGGAHVVGPQALESRVSNGEQFHNPFEQDGLSLQADWDLGWAQLTYIGAMRNFKAESVQESDFVDLNVFTVGGPSQPAGLPTSYDEIESQSHELRLTGSTDRFKWLVGAYVSSEDIEEL